MQPITEDGLSRIVQAFALAAIDPSQWLPALSLVSDATGAVCSSLEYVDLNTGEAAMECSFPLEGSVLRDYEEHIFHINPRVHRTMALPVGKVIDDYQLRWADDPTAAEFRDWLDAMPYSLLEGGKILESRGHVGFFSTHFNGKHGDLVAANAQFHRALLPHIINMHEVGRALSGNRLRNELVTHHSLDGDKPFALLDRAGGLIECSPAFEAVLRSSNLLGLRERRLIGRHHQHRGLVERFLHSALGDSRYVDRPLPIRLTGPANLRGLVLRAIPIPPREDIFDIFRPAALITLVDLDAPLRVHRRELASLFGLTARESEVAALVGEGNTVEQAATRLGIAHYTVKQHLKAIFGKMYIERQADLVAIVARL